MNNIYQAPEAEVLTKEQAASLDELELASRWARLGAYLIDGLILTDINLIAYYINYFAQGYDRYYSLSTHIIPS